MTPPDTNLQKQKKRHRGPLIGIALVVIFGFGLIAYWVLEEAAMAPGPDDGAEEQTPAAMPGGGGAPSVPAQDETLQPGDPEVEVGPRGEGPTDD